MPGLEGLPTHELPDLRLRLVPRANLGEYLDRRTQVRHRLVMTTGSVQQVGQVVVQRRLPVPVPDRGADTQVVCVDKKRQWSKWTNVWHSSAIRSSVYMLGAPYRGVRSLFRRGSSAKTRT